MSLCIANYRNGSSWVHCQPRKGGSRGAVAAVKNNNMDFPGVLVVKNSPADAGDKDLIPAPGRFHMCEATKLMCHNY